MTEPQALKRGRERAYRARTREAIKRVRAYDRWCATDSKRPGGFRTMPAIPSSTDFKLARQQGSAGASHRLNGSAR